jgi:hypothetical protein
MPIRDDVLFSRLVNSLNHLSLCVQTGTELDNPTIKRIHEVVNHCCMPSGFVGQNEDYFKETINLLLEYIETLERPHALIKEGKASPALQRAFIRGELKDKGISLIAPTTTIMACYDDNKALKYYSLSKGA